MLTETNDVNKALRDIENFLRDNIMYILKNKYGDSWENHLGVTESRIEKWKERRDEEQVRLKGQVSENRLLYYSDFYDLKTIITKNWDTFSVCFKDKKIIEYKLEQLESYRNPNAHNRDLLDYQEQLLYGIIGDIKADIMRYRGDIEKISTYFPELISINVNGVEYKNYAHTNRIFRPGDKIEIIIYVSTPTTSKIYYKMKDGDFSLRKETEWQESNHFTIEVTNDNLGQISKKFYFKTDLNYHAQKDYDGLVIMSYYVVPIDG